MFIHDICPPPGRSFFVLLVGLYVCLSVRLLENLKSSEQICMKLPPDVCVRAQGTIDYILRMIRITSRIKWIGGELLL